MNESSPSSSSNPLPSIGFCHECTLEIQIFDPESLVCPNCSGTFIELSTQGAPAHNGASPDLPNSLSGLLESISWGRNSRNDVSRGPSLSNRRDASDNTNESFGDPDEVEIVNNRNQFANGRAQSGSGSVPITNLAQYLSDAFDADARHSNPRNNPFAEDFNQNEEPIESLTPPRQRTRTRSRSAVMNMEAQYARGGPREQVELEFPGPVSYLHSLLNIFGSGLGFGATTGVAQGGVNVGDYAWGPDGFNRILNDLMVQAQGQNGPTPASEEVIAALPRIQLTLAMLKLATIDDCAICREEFLEEEVLKLPCPHYFHPECIKEWLVASGTCPVCRYCVVPQTAGAAPAVVVPPPTNRHSRQASHQLLPGTFPGDEDEIMRDLDLD